MLQNSGQMKRPVGKGIITYIRSTEWRMVNVDETTEIIVSQSSGMLMLFKKDFEQ